MSKTTKHDFFKSFNIAIYNAFKIALVQESEKREGLLNPYKLIEDLRWSGQFRAVHGEEFAIPNAYRAYYLRVIIHHIPQFKSRIKLMKSGADEMTDREMALLAMGKNPDTEPKIENKTFTLF